MTILLTLLFGVVAFGKKDYSDCKWFGGNYTEAPFYPIDVCESHSHENELDGLYLYSTRLECGDNGELYQYEWNDTDCNGSPYNTITYLKGISIYIYVNYIYNIIFK